MIKYIIGVDNGYIKHTARFGPFYGSIVITANRNEARLFSREKDAIKCMNLVHWRIQNYEQDKKKFPNHIFCFVKEINTEIEPPVNCQAKHRANDEPSLPMCTCHNFCKYDGLQFDTDLA